MGLMDLTLNDIIQKFIGPDDADMDITAMKNNLDPKDPNIIYDIAKKIDVTKATPLGDSETPTLGDLTKKQNQVRLLEQMQKHYIKRYGTK
jgi:hypothetical protein